jgi:hypothetical protein
MCRLFNRQPLLMLKSKRSSTCLNIAFPETSHGCELQDDNNLKEIKMKKSLNTLLLTTATLLCCVTLQTQAQAQNETDETPVYGFVASGFSQSNAQLNVDGQRFKAATAPHFELGLGKDFILNDDWTLENKVSFKYSKAQFKGIPADMKQWGLWNTATLKHHNLLSFATPFIELGVGIVDTSLSMEQQRSSDRFIAFEANVGLEFEVTEGFSFIFAVGDSNVNDKNLAPWFKH